ncbi:MAG: dTDP-4-dehydrorhamnose 3,5-epimerase [Acidobacteria bacterium]|nr:MAG: dTDP-4-dehydrorhamnose 3,5-epimerase [Acidobacteriota bacterium]RLE35922.1 MAG: dTDP-4-dehydrorhamnose 3,5-epimerase [Acidobacteriota bacterium]
MKVLPTSLPGVFLIEPTVFGDHRGFFMESYSQRSFAEHGLDRDWVQDNHSRSSRGVLRGLHYQLGRPQAKLVRAVLGSVFDVVVDVRHGSPTFGQWYGAELSAKNQRQLFAPRGMAHGFVVLSDVAEFLYKVDDFHAPEEERSVAWNDPGIGIKWPLPEGIDPILSPKDTDCPQLAEMPADQLPVYRADPDRREV